MRPRLSRSVTSSVTVPGSCTSGQSLQADAELAPITYHTVSLSRPSNASLVTPRRRRDKCGPVTRPSYFLFLFLLWRGPSSSSLIFFFPPPFFPLSSLSLSLSPFSSVSPLFFPFFFFSLSPFFFLPPPPPPPFPVYKNISSLRSGEFNHDVT